MVSLECDTTVAGDRTLVTVVLESDEPTQVRVENCLDGPVRPPRRRGVPVAGWDSDGFAGVVDGTLALGYATPADPVDPPARIADQRPPADDDGLTAEALVRKRGDGTPPRDAVGAVPITPAEASPPDGKPSQIATTDEAPTDETPADEAEADEVPTDGCSSTEETPGQSRDDSVPTAVEAWVDGVAERVSDAERLSSATSLEEATAAVADVGGADEVRSLRDRLERDRETLRAVRRRCEALEKRTAAVEVPVEALSRLS